MNVTQLLVAGALGGVGYYATSNVVFAVALVVLGLVLSSLKLGTTVVIVGSLVLGGMLTLYLGQSINLGGLGYPQWGINAKVTSPTITLPSSWMNSNATTTTVLGSTSTTASTTSTSVTSTTACSSQCCIDSQCSSYNGAYYFGCTNGLCEVKTCLVSGDCPVGYHCDLTLQCAVGT